MAVLSVDLGSMAFKDRSAFFPQLLHRTPEGYLQGYIRVTCAGVFRYLGDDGKTIIRVYRPESEVGDLESVLSANSKPIVLPRLIKSPYKIYFLNIPYFMRVRKRLDAEKIRKIG